MATQRVETRDRSRLPWLLAGLYAVIWTVAAIDPLSRQDWLLENLLVALTLAIVVWGYWRHPLSDTSYVLITIFMATHAVGAHYTYAEAPPGFWMQEAFGLERNHYDRVIHCAYGLLLALPFRELVVRTGTIRRPWDSVFAASIIFATSALYEIVEWWVAMIVSPEAAMAFLGTQGDPFDAQKDTALAMAGSVVALLIAEAIRPAATKKRLPTAT